MSLAHSYECIRHRVVAISQFERTIATDSHRFDFRIALVSVDVHTVAGRSHDYVVSLES